MTTTFGQTFQSAAQRINYHLERHRGSPQISLPEHIRAARKERASRISSKHLIYLDTNAWKCLADYKEGKPRLTTAMTDFAQAMERAQSSDKFVFPIGLSTFFELDSMTSQATHDTLLKLVDGLSQGYCIAPFTERIGQEIEYLTRGELATQEDASQFLRSPFELLGIPVASFDERVASPEDQVTFSKAFFDTLAELPFSLQLEISRSAPGPKWSNSREIPELNQGKVDHQEVVSNLNTGIFLELQGSIRTWCAAEDATLSPEQISLLTLNAQFYWHQHPTSRSLPTLRVLSALYGLMRYDPQRRYKEGDPADFLAAAAALPVAHALFTDRRLAALLSDSRIAINKFTSCSVISGFDQMADYLTQKS